MFSVGQVAQNLIQPDLEHFQLLELFAGTRKNGYFYQVAASVPALSAYMQWFNHF